MFTFDKIYQVLEVFFKDYGYLVVFIGMLLESIIYVGILIPGTLIAILAGFYAQQGNLSLSLTILLTLIGAMLGDNVSYLIGKYGWNKIISKTRLYKWFNKLNKVIDKGLWKYLLIYHYSANIRVFFPTIAGSLKIPFKTWIIFDSLGLIIWGVSMNLIGYFIGSQVGRIENILNIESKIGWVILVIFALWIGWSIYSFRKMIIEDKKSEKNSRS
jgi:membrane-associated protein